MAFKLSKYQQEALPYIQWLLDWRMSSRRTGRSILMAYVFLIIAKETGSPISIFDHTKYPNNLHYLKKEILGLMETEEFKDYEIKLSDSAIQLIKK